MEGGGALSEASEEKWSIESTCLNVMPDSSHIVAVVLKPAVDSCDATLASTLIIHHKVFAGLVDGVVGQV